MRQVIATILFALLPGVAAAQAGWQSYTNAVSGYTGAVACPVSDDAGHFYCLAVECPPWRRGRFHAHDRGWRAGGRRRFRDDGG